MSADDAVARLLNKDAALWRQHGFSDEQIADWLGWVDADQWLDKHLIELQQWAHQTIQQGEFSQIVLLGMGGSSMAARVVSSCLPRVDNFPPLLILDTSSPEQVNRCDFDLASTLFIVSSKSGTTVESLSLMAHFYARLETLSNTPNNQFIAITDQDTWLHRHAQEKNFRKIFVTADNIGGRYSALSHYGLVPCLLSGTDASIFVDATKDFYQQLQSDQLRQEMVSLATEMARHMNLGQYKMKFVLGAPVADLFFWLEQLIAESSGKQGKGLLPIVSEAIDLDDTTSFFVQIDVATEATADAAVGNRQGIANEIGERSLRQVLSSTDHVGALFLFWQMVTTIACLLARINPFNQPDVEKSKQQARLFLQRKTDLGFLNLAFDNEAYRVYQNGSVRTDDLSFLVDELLAKKQCYLSILAYLPDLPEIEEQLQNLLQCFNQKNYTVTHGYGPRYLHSTGQIHKGGPDKGVFLQIVEAQQQPQIPIPGQDYGFAELYGAQADGDITILHNLGHQIMRIELKADRLRSLSQLISHL